jgi:hypothetical protein
VRVVNDSGWMLPPGGGSETVTLGNLDFNGIVANSPTS